MVICRIVLSHSILSCLDSSRDHLEVDREAVQDSTSVATRAAARVACQANLTSAR
jgi:hypothetical protein